MIPTPSDELTIRQAGDADWPAIWPIWQEIVAAAETIPYDPATSCADARRGWLAAPPHETWLALDGGRAVGTYHLAPNYAGPGAHVANASYMVAAAARGRGVGRALVEHSLSRAADAGYRGMQFNAVVATNVPAVTLYERLGFETIGRVPEGFCHPTHGYVDLLIMYRKV